MESKQSTGQLAVDALQAVLKNVKSSADDRDLTLGAAEVIRAAADLYRVID